MEETFLKCDEFPVRFLNTLGRLDELLDRVLLVQEEVDDVAEPSQYGRLGGRAVTFAQLLQRLLELLLCVNLFFVQLVASLLKLLEGTAETGEVDRLHNFRGCIANNSVEALSIQ